MHSSRINYNTNKDIRVKGLLETIDGLIESITSASSERFLPELERVTVVYNHIKSMDSDSLIRLDPNLDGNTINEEKDRLLNSMKANLKEFTERHTGFPVVSDSFPNKELVDGYYEILQELKKQPELKSDSEVLEKRIAAYNPKAMEDAQQKLQGLERLLSDLTNVGGFPVERFTALRKELYKLGLQVELKDSAEALSELKEAVVNMFPEQYRATVQEGLDSKTKELSETKLSEVLQEITKKEEQLKKIDTSSGFSREHYEKVREIAGNKLDEQTLVRFIDVHEPLFIDQNVKALLSQVKGAAMGILRGERPFASQTEKESERIENKRARVKGTYFKQFNESLTAMRVQWGIGLGASTVILANVFKLEFAGRVPWSETTLVKGFKDTFGEFFSGLMTLSPRMNPSMEGGAFLLTFVGGLAGLKLLNKVTDKKQDELAERLRASLSQIKEELEKLTVVVNTADPVIRNQSINTSMALLDQFIDFALKPLNQSGIGEYQRALKNYKSAVLKDSGLGGMDDLDSAIKAELAGENQASAKQLQQLFTSIEKANLHAFNRGAIVAVIESIFPNSALWGKLVRLIARPIGADKGVARLGRDADLSDQVLRPLTLLQQKLAIAASLGPFPTGLDFVQKLGSDLNSLYEQIYKYLGEESPDTKRSGLKAIVKRRTPGLSFIDYICFY